MSDYFIHRAPKSHGTGHQNTQGTKKEESKFFWYEPHNPAWKSFKPNVQSTLALVNYATFSQAKKTGPMHAQFRMCAHGSVDNCVRFQWAANAGNERRFQHILQKNYRVVSYEIFRPVQFSWTNLQSFATDGQDAVAQHSTSN